MTVVCPLSCLIRKLSIQTSMRRRTPTAASVLTLALPFACSDPLTMLAYKHGTDKASHGFTSFYHK